MSCSTAWYTAPHRSSLHPPSSFFQRRPTHLLLPISMSWLFLLLVLSAHSSLAQRGSLNISSSTSCWPGLFTQLAAASFDGVISFDYSMPPGMPTGYVQSLPQPQPWWGTMWTRDAGTFLRECVLWGDLKTAAAAAQVLLQVAPLNPSGFIAYPGRFDLLKPGDTSLSEVDASASIFISSTLLWHRLPPAPPCTCRCSPFFLETPLLCGDSKRSCCTVLLSMAVASLGAAVLRPVSG
jgi:hypothetical protein